MIEVRLRNDVEVGRGEGIVRHRRWCREEEREEGEKDERVEKHVAEVMPVKGLWPACGEGV
jgi:hypothetical protein